MDKKALSKTICEVLGIDVDFSKLKTDDLQKLYKHVTNPVNLIGIIVRSTKSMTGEMIDKLPIREIGDLRIRDIILSGRGRGGPLGLGILDRLLSSKEEKSKT